MNARLIDSVKRAVRPALLRVTHPTRPRFLCPVCNYRGPFRDKRPAHRGGVTWAHSKCPSCAAAERHRLQWLALDTLLAQRDTSRESFLHIAPEPCLQPRLRAAFATYHTADLLRGNVDFKADLQSLPFDDASYDWVFVSRVLLFPPDLHACIREIRRVLRPGGAALLSELYAREDTIDLGPEGGEYVRHLGVDALRLYEQHFDGIDLITSDDFPAEHQLVGRSVLNGRVVDDYPALFRAPGLGIKEVLAVCRVD